MKSVKNIFKLSRTQWISVAVLASSLGLAVAVTVPNTFVANTLISATAVNDNFQALVSAVTAVETGKVNKAGDTMTGALTAPSFVYSAPVAGQVIALPNSCMRSGGAASPSAIEMDLEMGSVSPPGNSFGPSVASNSTSNVTVDFFCPIPLHVPPGAAVTITGATLASTDFSANCRVQAQIRTKPFGVSSFGTIVSTVTNGVDAADFAFTGGPVTKAFPAFTLAVPSNVVVWVNATIVFAAVGGGDCRYSGVLVDYTVSKP